MTACGAISVTYEEVGMCRSIKTLRPPYTTDAGPADVHAAALQYVRKISGFRAPSRANTAAFDDAVDAVAQATERLLAELAPIGARRAPAKPAEADHSARPR
jgi:hypothetical protein